MEKEKMERLPFEDALNMTGFGLYNYMMALLTGMSIIAFACIGYGSSILVPASACELETSVAQQGALAAAPLIGSIIGAVIWGYLGDTRGRRSMLILCLILAVIFNAIASISVNWVMLLAFQFVATSMGTGAYTLSVTLLSECVPFAKRNVLLLVVASIFMLAQGIMAVLAIPIIPLSFSYYLPTLDIYWNSWRTLTLVYCAPALLCIALACCFHESPKFLLARGEEERALEVLRSIHRVNQAWSNEKTGFDVNGLQMESLKQSSDNADDNQDGQIKPLFKFPLLKSTIIMSCLYAFQQVGSFQVWLPRISNEFIQSVQAGETGSNLCGLIRLAVNAEPDDSIVPCSINKNALLIVFGVGCLQSLMNLANALLVNKLGRRTLIMMLTAFCGVCGIVVNLIPQAVASGVLFLLFLMGTTVLGLYTATAVSLFPTKLRALALSLTVSVGRMATFGVIQLLNYLLTNQCEVGFYIFASLFASSAIVVSFLPNDKVRFEPSDKERQADEDNHSQRTKL